MAAGPQRPRDAASDFDYRLRRCEGFRVDSPQGRVGFVEEVRYASRCDRPDMIAVRVGLLGRLLLIVPVGEVAEILPSEERIVLHRSPRPTAAEHARGLRRVVDVGGAGRAGNSEVEGVAAGATHDAQREAKAVIKRVKRRIGLRLGRGGEGEITSDVEPSVEPSAEGAPAEEQATEEPAAEAAPAEAVRAEEPATEEPTGEEQATA
jgi:hypothetical protein